MRFARMPIEIESPEEYGYGNIRNNLSESSVSDRTLGGLGLSFPDLKLFYGEHRGSPALRRLIASGGDGITPEDVLLTSGAATALFIIATALLGRDDHLVVMRPNYATNLATPRAIGCGIGFVDLVFDDGFVLDIGALAAAITPATRIISVTTPHNPSGVMLSEDELRALAALAANHGCVLLVDETYRDLAYTPAPPLAASLGSHVVSVSSLSKAYGVPGIRIGWLVTRDPALQELFLAAKEQISICGSVLDEWIAEQILSRRDDFLAPMLDEMRARLDIVADWIAREPLLDWVRPHGGVVCFPRMTAEPPGGTDAFYRRLLDRHGTYVGPGHWFEMPDRCFRLGYGWPTRDALAAGLDGISAALRG